MKKIIYTLIILTAVFMLPNGVSASDAVYDKFKSSITDNSWSTTSKGNYVDILVKTSITKEEYDNTFARFITIYYCKGKTTCDLDAASDNDTYIDFELKKSDSGYTLSAYTTTEVYNAIKSNDQIYYYAVEDESFDVLKTGKLTFTKVSVEEDETLSTKGTLNNPYIISGTGTIIIPNSSDAIWNTTSNKLYFKVNLPSNETGTYGRYNISSNDLGKYIYAINSSYSDTNNNTIMSDADDETLWLFSNSQTYYLYAIGTNVFGKNMTITFVDNKMITTYTDVAKIELENTYYDDSKKAESTSNIPEYTETSGCAILGEHVTPMVKWAIRLIYLLIPILIIILTIVEFTKIVLSADEKEYKTAINHLIKRIGIGVAITVTPTIISILIDLSGILNQYGITDDLFCSLFK